MGYVNSEIAKHLFRTLFRYKVVIIKRNWNFIFNQVYHWYGNNTAFCRFFSF